MKHKIVALFTTTFLFFLSGVACADQNNIDAMKLECSKVNNIQLPVQDKPTASEKERIEKNSTPSSTFYYGLNGSVDYVKARKYAFLEMDTDTCGTSVVCGRSLLEMIYANGLGVSRNLSFALHLACSSPLLKDSQDETDWSTVADLLKLKNPSSSNKQFDACDSAYGNIPMNDCNELKIQVATFKDKNEIKKMMIGWTPVQKQMLDNLVNAAFSFFDDRVNLEISLVAAAPGQRYLMDQSNPGDPLDLRKKFISNLQNYEKGQFPENSYFKKSDEVLNQIYQKMSSCLEKSTNTDEDCKLGRVDKEQLLANERKWLKYRDTWVKFGAARYPKVPAPNWETWLTNERVADLKQMPIGAMREFS